MNKLLLHQQWGLIVVLMIRTGKSFGEIRDELKLVDESIELMQQGTHLAPLSLVGAKLPAPAPTDGVIGLDHAAFERELASQS